MKIGNKAVKLIAFAVRFGTNDGLQQAEADGGSTTAELGGATVAKTIAAHLADAIATTNPKFDRDKFLAACDPTKPTRLKPPTAKGKK